MPDVPAFTPAQRAFVAAARTATLATIGPDGSPRLVPICFVLLGAAAWSPLDEKPKQSTDPHDLARVRDVRARPGVSLLVHHWDEDWSLLAWIRLGGVGDVVEPGASGHAAAVGELRSKYPQYQRHAIDRRPMLRITIEVATAWRATDEPRP